MVILKTVKCMGNNANFEIKKKMKEGYLKAVGLVTTGNNGLLVTKYLYFNI